LLSTIVAPFNDPSVGAVTCLYTGAPLKGLASQLFSMFILSSRASLGAHGALGTALGFCLFVYDRSLAAPCPIWFHLALLCGWGHGAGSHTPGAYFTPLPGSRRRHRYYWAGQALVDSSAGLHAVCGMGDEFHGFECEVRL